MSFYSIFPWVLNSKTTWTFSGINFTRFFSQKSSNVYSKIKLRNLDWTYFQNQDLIRLNSKFNLTHGLETVPSLMVNRNPLLIHPFLHFVKKNNWWWDGSLSIHLTSCQRPCQMNIIVFADFAGLERTKFFEVPACH